MRVCHKSMAHPLLCYLLYNPRSIVAYSKKSILGAAPFALLLPYANLSGTIALAVIIGFVISSAFSAILVYATDLMPGKVGLVSGIFFGLMFGLGGIGSAFFGWLADRTNIEFIFRVSTLLPLLGVITGFLPNIEKRRKP